MVVAAAPPPLPAGTAQPAVDLAIQATPTPTIPAPPPISTGATTAPPPHRPWLLAPPQPPPHQPWLLAPPQPSPQLLWRPWWPPSSSSSTRLQSPVKPLHRKSRGGTTASLGQGFDTGAWHKRRRNGVGSCGGHHEGQVVGRGMCPPTWHKRRRIGGGSCGGHHEDQVVGRGRCPPTRVASLVIVGVRGQR